MSVRINQFEVENVKRVKAVEYDCSAKSLTVIGGGNAQGKTSLLDGIMWTLGGDRFKPSDPLRKGADKLATRIELSNGIVVERGGVNGALKVTDETGARAGGQQLLNEFVSAFALNMPSFMAASASDKSRMLLDCFPGLGQKLKDLNDEVKRLFDERHAVGQVALRKKKHAEDLPFNEDVPSELLTGTQMTQRLQDMLRKNAENDRLRKDAVSLKLKRDSAASRVDELKRQLKTAEFELEALRMDLERADSASDGLKDDDTSGLQVELEEIDAKNAKIRQNMDKSKAESDAEELSEEYNGITGKLEAVRAERVKLLAGVEMPLDDLSFDEDGKLMYRAAQWDGMSGAEQMRVAVAICAAVKPECGFVLVDGLEKMDRGQLHEFGAWLESRGLQAIGTRVSTGDECSIVIENGELSGAAPRAEEAEEEEVPENEFRF